MGKNTRSSLKRSRERRGVTFDTGALIALERRRASALELLKACRQSRVRITIPAAVIAGWWRGTPIALLEIGYLEALTPELAKAAGDLLAKAGRSDAVDATVIVSAAQRGDIVVTDDPLDLSALSAHVQGVDVHEI